MIYLDNSATTYPKPEIVYQAIDYANRELAFNAGRGDYRQSKEAFRWIEEARKQIADYIQVESNQVIFTSSATESLNAIILGLHLKEGDHVYVSVFEHNSLLRPLYAIEGIHIHLIPFSTKDWSLKKDELENMFAIHKPKAVLLSQISNVTGYELPYHDIFNIANKYGSINVLDAAQCYGIIKPKISACNYIIFAGHKSLYCSFGVAGILKLKNDVLKPMKFGGTGLDTLNKQMPDDLPYRFEAGSNNLVAIYGLIAGMKWVQNQDIAEHEYRLANYFIKHLKAMPHIILFLPDNIRTLGIVSFAVKGYKAYDVAEILSEEFDICVRSGYHCAPLIHDFIGSTNYGGTIRVSIGAFNTKDDLDIFIQALETFI